MANLIKADSLRRAGRMGDCFVDAATAARTERRRKPGNASSPEEQANLILDEARDRADSVIAQARVEAERIRAAAYAEGREDATGKLEAAGSALERRAAEFEAEVERQIKESWTILEREVLKLSVEVAQKILRREVESDEFVLTTVTDGLRQLRDKRDLKIRANPGDFRFLREHKEDLIASFDGIQSVDVIEDRRVDKGGCLIESTNGHLDGRIETQLKEVERALLEAHEEGRHGAAA